MWLLLSIFSKGSKTAHWDLPPDSVLVFVEVSQQKTSRKFFTICTENICQLVSIANIYHVITECTCQLSLYCRKYYETTAKSGFDAHSVIYDWIERNIRIFKQIYLNYMSRLNTRVIINQNNNSSISYRNKLHPLLQCLIIETKGGTFILLEFLGSRDPKKYNWYFTDLN